MERHQLLPYIKLNFGKEEINESSLPGGSQLCVSGASKNQKISYEEMQERIKYLEKSSHVLPLIKFFNVFSNPHISNSTNNELIQTKSIMTFNKE